MKNIRWGKLLISLSALPLIFGAWAAVIGGIQSDFSRLRVFFGSTSPEKDLLKFN